MKLRKFDRRLLVAFIFLLLLISTTLLSFFCVLYLSDTIFLTFPSLYFFPETLFIEVIAISACNLGLVIIGSIGVKLHKRLFLKLFVLGLLAVIIAEAYLMNVAIQDFFSENEFDHKIPTSTTQPLTTSLIYRTLEFSTQNPALWKAIQDILQCCGLNLQILYHPFNLPVTNQTMIQINTGSTCSENSTHFLNILFAANEFLEEQTFLSYDDIVSAGHIPEFFFCQERAHAQTSTIFIPIIASIAVLAFVQVFSFIFGIRNVLQKKVMKVGASDPGYSTTRVKATGSFSSLSGRKPTSSFSSNPNQSSSPDVLNKKRMILQPPSVRETSMSVSSNPAAADNGSFRRMTEASFIRPVAASEAHIDDDTNDHELLYGAKNVPWHAPEPSEPLSQRNAQHQDVDPDDLELIYGNRHS